MPFDPEGAGYDMEAAIAAGIRPIPDPSDNNRPHWPSRHPETGQMLKGRAHPTFDLAIKADEALGYVLTKAKDGKYYSYQSHQSFYGDKLGPPEASDRFGSAAQIKPLPEYPSQSQFLEHGGVVEELPSGEKTFLEPSMKVNPPIRIKEHTKRQGP